MGRDPDASAQASARVGLFGGTFDPPHRGHVAVASDVADALELDRVLWIPAGEPPHKTGDRITPARLRLEMTRAAAAADARFEVSDVEAEREGASYTVDTVRALRESDPDARLFLIVGTDQFSELGTWRASEELLRLVELVVMDRDGLVARDHVPDVPGADAARFVSVRRIDVSSTDVRAAVRDGRDVSELVPDAVSEIIGREGLYTD